MKNISKFLTAFVIFMLLINSCKTSRTTKEARMAGYVSGNYEIECMGTGMDGTQLVKVWGFGTDPDQAAYQSRKKCCTCRIIQRYQCR